MGQIVPFVKDPPPLDTSALELRPRRQWFWQVVLFVVGVILGAILAVALALILP